MRHLAKQILYWIVYAAGQLSALELQEALAVEEGTSKLDKENKPDLDDMISVCVGLVTIDDGSNVIRLVHYTTQEFLQNLPDWVSTAQLAIAKMCLTYLAFRIFEAGFGDYDDNDYISREEMKDMYSELFRVHPFLRYAIEY